MTRWPRIDLELEKNIYDEVKMLMLKLPGRN